MKNISKKDFDKLATDIQKYYDIDNFLSESTIWYDFCSMKTQIPINLSITNIIDHHAEFFPAIKRLY
jgi:hypothetical protein